MFQGEPTKSVKIAELTAMVIDNNIDMRRLVRSLLYAVGFRELFESSDGGEAMQELKFRPADLIITSWTMHPIDGIVFNLRKRMRWLEPRRVTVCTRP